MMRGLGAAVLALAVAAGVAACSGDSPERVPVPEGFREYRHAEVGFAHPAAWQRRSERDDNGRPVRKINGPVLPSGFVDGQVHLARYPDRGIPFHTSLNEFRMLARLHGYRITAEDRPRIAGAAQTRRFDAEYDLTSERGGKTPVKLRALYAQLDDGVLFEFIVRSPRGSSSAALVPGIVGTFRIVEG